METFAQLRLLSDNLSNLLLIHFLVGMACESLLVSAAYRNRATWSLTDAGRVALLCETVLSREPAIARAAKGEHLLAFRFISEGLAGPESLAESIEFQIEREVPNEAERALIQRLRRLTPPEMNALRARVLAKSEENLAKALKILAGPEKDWVSQLPSPRGSVD